MSINEVFTGTLTGLLILVFAFVWQTTLSGVTRKIVARFHKRYGPKFYQEFRDIFKLLTKTGISHGWIYNFGVMMALGGIMGTAMFMPVMQFGAFPGLDNIFIYVYLFAVGMLGMAMSAVGSGNPLAGIGVMRALTQMVGYEVPFMVVVLAMVYGHGTASVSELAAVQQTAGLATWNMSKCPSARWSASSACLGCSVKSRLKPLLRPRKSPPARWWNTAASSWEC